MKSISGRVRRVHLRAVLVVIAFGWSFTGAWAGKNELPLPVGEVKLKDGTVLEGVTFVSVGESSVTGKWDGGRGSIPLAMLPDAVRAELAAAAPPKPVPLATSTPAAPADPSKLPTEIKLNSGFVMHQAKVLGWRDDAMTVEYVGGKVLVKYDDIVPEERMVFVARKIEMFAVRDRVAAARAALATGQTPPAASAGGLATNELPKLIQAGIGAHQLVVGMNRQETVQAIGMPDGVQYDKSRPEAAYWLYRGRGKTAAGAVCDRILGFEKGILQGWKDQ